jgi:hypothetical protein
MGQTLNSLKVALENCVTQMEQASGMFEKDREWQKALKNGSALLYSKEFNVDEAVSKDMDAVAQIAFIAGSYGYQTPHLGVAVAQLKLWAGELEALYPEEKARVSAAEKYITDKMLVEVVQGRARFDESRIPGWMVDALGKKHLPSNENAAEKEKHYSERILAELAEKYGWKTSKDALSTYKDVGGNPTRGSLNPDGTRLFVGAFDERGRYLELSDGFKAIFDIDCRGRDIQKVAGEFDDRATAWAIFSCIELSSLKVPFPTPGKTQFCFYDAMSESLCSKKTLEEMLVLAEENGWNDFSEVCEGKLVQKFHKENGCWFGKDNVAVGGLFSGKVMSVKDGIAVQKIGRNDNNVVRHDLRNLSRPPEVGEVVEIKYGKGTGQIVDRSAELAR